MIVCVAPAGCLRPASLFFLECPATRLPEDEQIKQPQTQKFQGLPHIFPAKRMITFASLDESRNKKHRPQNQKQAPDGITELAWGFGAHSFNYPQRFSLCRKHNCHGFVKSRSIDFAVRAQPRSKPRIKFRFLQSLQLHLAEFCQPDGNDN
jgi:hypothetical protein